MPVIVNVPEPPYYAVIFVACFTGDMADYERTARRMAELAAQTPGFLGLESAHESGGEVVVSYWESEEAIRGWKAQLEHGAAQERGRAEWYRRFAIRVARVERAYTFERD